MTIVNFTYTPENKKISDFDATDGMMKNFNDIKDVVNGNLDSSNLANDAITQSKLDPTINLSTSITISNLVSAWTQSSQNYDASIGDNIVTLATEQWDLGGEFAANKLTPAASGWWHVTATVSKSSGFGADEDIDWALFKNGVLYQIHRAEIRGSLGSRPRSCCVSAIIPFNGTTDYVQLHAADESPTESPADNISATSYPISFHARFIGDA